MEPEEKHRQTHNYQTTHTNEPYLSVSPQQDAPEYNQKISTPLQRSTQAYYDSQQPRSRNPTRTTPPQRPQSQHEHQPRTFRHEMTFLAYPGKERQFLAYCVVVKESNSGIFSHERFMVLDSIAKELRYYSQVPPLPLRSVDQLKAPKEVIKLNSKVGYRPSAGIGEVIVTSVGSGGRKEWHLTMGSRKMVREFGIVLEQIRKNQYVSGRQLKRTLAHIIEEMYEHKTKKIDTPFISQIKELQKKSRDSSQSESLKSSRKKEEKSGNKNERKERRLSSVYSIKVEGSSESELGQGKIKQPGQGKEMAKDEILLQKIIEAAEEQHRSKSKTAYIKNFDEPSLNEPSELQKVLKRRKQATLEYELQGVASSKSQQMSDSKIIVSKVPALHPPKPKTKAVVPTDKGLSTLVRSKGERQLSSKYQESERQYRMALLEERRQNYATMVKNKVNRHSHPRRESVSKAASSNSQLPFEGQKWMVGWLKAANSQERGSLYSSFIDHCVDYLTKLTHNFDDWHLFHKTQGDQYLIEDSFVEYTYFMIVGTSKKQQLRKQEQALKSEFLLFDHILASIARQDLAEVVKVPLCCIVQIKGLTFFCKASLVPEKIKEASSLKKERCQEVIDRLESRAGVSLRNCEFVEVQMSGRDYLYMRKAEALPKVFKNARIDGAYIRQFIKEGSISSQLDLQSIELHLRKRVIPQLSNQLAKNCVLSCVELKDLFFKEGGNLSILPQLYQHAREHNEQKTVGVVISQITAQIVAKRVREQIHEFLLEKKVEKDITSVVFSQILQFLGSPQVYFARVAESFLDLLSSELKADQWSSLLDYSYILSSILFELAFDLQIKHRTDFSLFEDLKFQYWRETSFTAVNFAVTAGHRVDKYQWAVFNDSYERLREQVLTKQVDKISLEREDIEKILNYDSKQPEKDSNFFKLLNEGELEKVKAALGCHYFLERRRNPVQGEQHWQLFYNLLHRPTAPILTRHNLTHSLTGIKWLASQGNSRQALLHLEELLQRVLIWGKSHPGLIQIYDALTQLHIRLTNSTESITFSLKAFQTAIGCFGGDFFRHWQQIWQRAYVAADTHFKVGKFEGALDLYSTACVLLSKVSLEDLKNSDIPPSFMQMHRKRIRVSLALCRIDEAMSLCHESAALLKGYLQVFAFKTEYIQVVAKEQFETHLLLLRCLEVRRQWKALLEHCGWCWSEFVEEELRIITKNTLTIKTNEFCQYRVKELSKCAWTAVIRNAEDLNRPALSSLQGRIQLSYLKIKLEQISMENHEIYHYSFDQIYKHLTDIILSYQRQEEGKEGVCKFTGSFFMTHLLKVLRQVQENRYSAERCKIYDKDAASNDLLFLECFAHLASYQYTIGALKSSLFCQD